MRKVVVLLALLAVVFAGRVSAAGNGGGLGIGIILGEPTGIAVKVSKIHGAIAWSTAGNWLHVHGDYVLYQNTNLISEFPLYIGVGAKVGIGSGVGLGVRVPIGLEYKFSDAPLDIFFEVVPGLGILPGIGFGVDGGIGIRYYF
ncbi:MAG: DUF3996 domain-containing protein [Elusimicrobiota bacterium]